MCTYMHFGTCTCTYIQHETLNPEFAFRKKIFFKVGIIKADRVLLSKMLDNIIAF